MSRMFFLFFFLTYLLNNAPAQFNHTIKFDETLGSPKASIYIMDFISGHWKGEAFGGITQEIWSPPLAGSIMCTFKLVVNGQVQFYEICTISEENHSLVLRIKHFDGQLKGWEEKDEVVEFKLVKIEEGKIYFDQFTFEHISDDEINIYVVIQDSGKESEVKFNYRKIHR